MAVNGSGRLAVNTQSGSIRADECVGRVGTESRVERSVFIRSRAAVPRAPSAEADGGTGRSGMAVPTLQSRAVLPRALHQREAHGGDTEAAGWSYEN